MKRLKKYLVPLAVVGLLFTGIALSGCEWKQCWDIEQIEGSEVCITVVIPI